MHENRRWFVVPIGEGVDSCNQRTQICSLEEVVSFISKFLMAGWGGIRKAPRWNKVYNLCCVVLQDKVKLGIGGT